MRHAIVFVLLMVATACGDDGGSSTDQPDAKVFEDAAPPLIDAPPTSTQMGIGQTCTPVAGNPQADCPVGFECLQLNGGSGPWCSKTCVRGPMTDTCNMGYVGPGLAACVYDITTMQGQPSRQFCGIICQATNPAQCSATQCDGTCPAPQMCTAELKDGNMVVVAKACF